MIRAVQIFLSCQLAQALLSGSEAVVRYLDGIRSMIRIRRDALAQSVRRSFDRIILEQEYIECDGIAWGGEC